MSRLNEITPGSITEIGGIDKQIIYFVTLAGGQKQVIKGEVVPSNPDDVAISVRWGTKLMKHVSNEMVGAKKMADNEIAVFKTAATAKWPPNDIKVQRLAAPWCWVKMLYVPGITDGEIIETVGRQKTYNAKLAIDALSKLAEGEHVWKELGKVLAVDIFNGNWDRFDESGVLQNRGNIIFVPPKTPTNPSDLTKVIGLDTFQTGGMNSTLNKPGTFGALDLLKENNVMGRRRYCETVVSSVGEEYAKLLKNEDVREIPIAVGGDGVLEFFPTEEIKKLFTAFAADVELGMLEGTRQLKNYLVGRLQKYRSWGGTEHRGLHKLPAQRQIVPPPQSAAAAAARAEALVTPPMLGDLGRAKGNTNLAGHKDKEVPAGILERMGYLGW